MKLGKRPRQNYDEERKKFAQMGNIFLSVIREGSSKIALFLVATKLKGGGVRSYWPGH